MRPHWEYRARVHDLVSTRAKFEGLDRDPRVTDTSSRFFDDALGLAMDTLAFYECFKCERPYFGGYKRCENAAMPAADAAGADADPHEGRRDLVCGGCVPDTQKASCPAHGVDFVDYKCKFCCGIATYYCWGKTHFCTECHRRQDRGEFLTRKPVAELTACPGSDRCPLGVEHPPNGTAEFALGCSLCREMAPRPH
jgi:hypothetical protein